MVLLISPSLSSDDSDGAASPLLEQESQCCNFFSSEAWTALCGTGSSSTSSSSSSSSGKYTTTKQDYNDTPALMKQDSLNLVSHRSRGGLSLVSTTSTPNAVVRSSTLDEIRGITNNINEKKPGSVLHDEDVSDFSSTLVQRTNNLMGILDTLHAAREKKEQEEKRRRQQQPKKVRIHCAYEDEDDGIVEREEEEDDDDENDDNNHDDCVPTSPGDVWYKGSEYAAMKAAFREDRQNTMSHVSSSTRGMRRQQEQQHVLFRTYRQCCVSGKQDMKDGSPKQGRGRKKFSRLRSNNTESSSLSDNSENSDDSTDAGLHRILRQELEEFFEDGTQLGLERGTRALSRDVMLRRDLLFEILCTHHDKQLERRERQRERRERGGDDLYFSGNGADEYKFNDDDDDFSPPMMTTASDDSSSSSNNSGSSSSRRRKNGSDDHPDSDHDDDDDDEALEALRIACQQVSKPSVLYAHEVAKALAATV